MDSNVTTICDCFRLLGCEKPFKTSNGIATTELTAKGNKTYEILRELIKFLNKSNVIDAFHEDKLDSLINEEGY